jgi:arsenate reductase (glutaredoxin)
VIADIVAKLEDPVHDLVRKDSVFAKLGLEADDYVDNPDAVIDVLVANPKLLQRPVVVRGKVAIIGRPKERVRQLLSKK